MFKQALTHHSKKYLSYIYNQFGHYQKEQKTIKKKYEDLTSRFAIFTLIIQGVSLGGDFFNFLPLNVVALLMTASTFSCLLFTFVCAHRQTCQIEPLYKKLTHAFTNKIHGKQELFKLLKELEDIQTNLQLYEIEEIISEIKLAYFKNQTLSMVIIEKLYDVMNSNYESIASKEQINKADKLFLQDNFSLEMEIGKTTVQKIL